MAIPPHKETGNKTLQGRPSLYQSKYFWLQRVKILFLLWSDQDSPDSYLLPPDICLKMSAPVHYPAICHTVIISHGDSFAAVQNSL